MHPKITGIGMSRLNPHAAEQPPAGKPPAESAPPETTAPAADLTPEQVQSLEKEIINILCTCFDPEIPINIVDLGLVYECRIEPRDDGTRSVKVKMTLTAPGCGMGEILVQDVREKLALIPTLSNIDVELVFDPPWNHGMMSDAARLQTGMMY